MLMIFAQLLSCESCISLILTTANIISALTRGMKTIYIRRTTEDLDEDMDKVKADVDLFIDGRDERGGLLELAKLWNV
jgi:hypothetical protein